jgi:hypothetical protein
MFEDDDDVDRMLSTIDESTTIAPSLSQTTASQSSDNDQWVKQLMQRLQNGVCIQLN